MGNRIYRFPRYIQPLSRLTAVARDWHSIPKAALFHADLDVSLVIASNNVIVHTAALRAGRRRAMNSKPMNHSSSVLLPQGQTRAAIIRQREDAIRRQSSERPQRRCGGCEGRRIQK